MTQLPDQAFEALPIFPLPALVLFPGAPMPIHVFEPRYRQLAEDTLKGHRLVGFPQLNRPNDPLPDIFGVGLIMAHEELKDGRYHLLFRGMARVRLVEECPADRPYRQVRCKVVPSTPGSNAHLLMTAAAQLLPVCRRIGPSAAEAADRLDSSLADQLPPGELADLVAATFVRDPEVRQRLLNTLEIDDRIGQLCDYLVTLVTQRGGGQQLLN